MRFLEFVPEGSTPTNLDEFFGIDTPCTILIGLIAITITIIILYLHRRKRRNLG